MVLLVLVIVLAIVFYILNPPPESTEILTPERVLEGNNEINYLNQEIIVKGTYFMSGDGPSVIPSTTDAEPDPDQILLLNLTGIIDPNDQPVEGNIYRFTGVLKELPTDIPGLLIVILDVNLVDPV
jgi:hypothetical protein